MGGGVEKCNKIEGRENKINIKKIRAETLQNNLRIELFIVKKKEEFDGKFSEGERRG